MLHKNVMVVSRVFGRACGFFVLMVLAFCTYAQDKIYTADGRVLTGKVIEISPQTVRYYQRHGGDSVLFVIYQRSVDSIVFSNGATEITDGFIAREKVRKNIPELNTWSFDLLGFAYLSISQSYERRLKNGKVGFRFPLYIGFKGGGVAGVGTFVEGSGVYYPAGGQSFEYEDPNKPERTYGGFSIATGINPKAYLFKHRKVRAFIGPEVTIGYSVSTNVFQSYTIIGNTYTPISYSTVERDGTFAAVAKFGLMFNPIDKFNICLDGGAGTICMFGSPNPLGWAGAWHIGFAMGTNF